MWFNTYTKCYESSICPILDYGAEVWGFTRAPNVDQVQEKAIRVFLGVHRFATTLAINGDMGWVPSAVRRKLAILRL